MTGGASGGVLGTGGPTVTQDMISRHPDVARQFLTAGMRPRAGHERARWASADWEDYKACVGIGQRRGPWAVTMIRTGLPDAWAAEALQMPHADGWYTALRHDERGTVMTDVPAEIAGMLPFLDAAAAFPARPAVLIAGLGLGIAPRWLLRNANPRRVDVVEYDPDVIALVTADEAARDDWAGDARLHVYQGDAHTWRPDGGTCVLHAACRIAPGHRWDLAWFDIWDTVSPRNLPSMHRLHRRFGRRAGRAWSWERAECEAQRARGQVLPWPCMNLGGDVTTCAVSEGGY